jgi:hypothetical protein
MEVDLRVLRLFQGQAVRLEIRAAVDAAGSGNNPKKSSKRS